MQRLRLLCIRLPLFAGIFLIIAKPAYADVGVAYGISSTLIRGGAANAGYIVITGCLSFIGVLLIEFFTIWWINRGRIPIPVWPAIVINVVSTIGGVILFYAFDGIVNLLGGGEFPLWVMIILIAGALSYMAFRITRSMSICLIVACSILVGILGYHLTLTSYRYGVWAMWVSIPLMLSLSFGITLALEAWPLRRYIPFENLRRTLLNANIYSYIFLLIISPLTWHNPVAQADWVGLPVETLIYEGKPEQAVQVDEWMSLSILELLGLKAETGQPGMEKHSRRSLLNAAQDAFCLFCIVGRTPDDKQPQMDRLCESIIEIIEIANDKSEPSPIEQHDSYGMLKYAAGIWPQVVLSIENGNYDEFRRLVEEWHETEGKEGWYAPGFPVWKGIVGDTVARIDCSSFSFIRTYIKAHGIDKTMAVEFESILTEIERSSKAYAYMVLGELSESNAENIAALKRALHDHDTRGKAATALGKLGPAGIAALIEALDSDSVLIRESAAHALYMAGPNAKAAIGALVGRLKYDDDNTVRHFAALALGGIGPDAKEAIPDLIGALSDPGPGVRIEAAVAIGKIGPTKDALPGLIALLDADLGACRDKAAQTLGLMGSDAVEALPKLRKLARNDKVLWVRKAAKEAIRKIEGRVSK